MNEAEAAPLDVLVLTGGHSVDLDALLGMVAAICEERGWRWAHARQPSAQAWLVPSAAGRWGAISPTTSLACGCGAAPAQTGRPSTGGPRVARGAAACWPGHRRHPSHAGGLARLGRLGRGAGRAVPLRPRTVRGRDWPSSGTRITTYTARVVAPDHPVCTGVDAFGLTDELYCCPVFEDDVVPLLRTDAPMDGALFISTYEHVLVGEADAPDCRAHPPASDLIGWATVAERSPVVYLQPGDTAATFGLEQYRRLLANSLAWVASTDAHRWAQAHPRTVPVDGPE